MKKGILAAILAVLVMAVAVKPAYAGTINANEDKLLGEFNAVVEEYRGMLGDDHANQYESQARSALSNDAIDLNDAAYGEFTQVIKDAKAVLTSNNVTTSAEASKHSAEMLEIINKVATKYNMKVSLDAKHYAVVTVTNPTTGKTSTVASTKTAVNQTGFGLAQTAVVAGAAVAVLAGAAFVARKNKLFA